MHADGGVRTSRAGRFMHGPRSAAGDRCFRETPWRQPVAVLRRRTRRARGDLPRSAAHGRETCSGCVTRGVGDPRRRCGLCVRIRMSRTSRIRLASTRRSPTTSHRRSRLRSASPATRLSSPSRTTPPGNVVRTSHRTRRISTTLRCAIRTCDDGCRFPAAATGSRPHITSSPGRAAAPRHYATCVLAVSPPSPSGARARLPDRGERLWRAAIPFIGATERSCHSPTRASYFGRRRATARHGTVSRTRNAELVIDASTAFPRWDGERVDYALAVQSLLESGDAPPRAWMASPLSRKPSENPPGRQQRAQPVHGRATGDTARPDVAPSDRRCGCDHDLDERPGSAETGRQTREHASQRVHDMDQSGGTYVPYVGSRPIEMRITTRPRS